jgi:hypothetical protein
MTGGIVEIQVSTDRYVLDAERLATFAGYEVVAGLGSCSTRVASATVDVTTALGPASTRALRCWLEVWPRGHPPFSVCRLGSTGRPPCRVQWAT